MKKPPLVVIVGPTAVGKTALSIDAAQMVPAEIISGDAMQVYRGMDIGTAKITKEERRDIPHHLINIVPPDFPFSVALFQKKAKEAIQAIIQRKKIPIIVGGTGLYIRAVTHNYAFAGQNVNHHLRRMLYNEADCLGTGFLYQRLKQIDPAHARKLHENDTKRIVRALENYYISGQKMSSQVGDAHQQSVYDLYMIGLTLERDTLYQKINARVDRMLAAGLIEEVKTLLEQGLSEKNVSLQAIGYKEIVGFLQGKTSLEEAIEMLKRNTRRFAKRQLTWFRHQHDIEWFSLDDPGNYPNILKKIETKMKGMYTYFSE